MTIDLTVKIKDQITIFCRATFFGLMLPGILASLAYLGVPLVQVNILIEN